MKRCEKYGCENCKWYSLKNAIGGGSFEGRSGGRCMRAGKNLIRIAICPGREPKQDKQK